jgi:hypothetical protein
VNGGFKDNYSAVVIGHEKKLKEPLTFPQRTKQLGNVCII